MMSHDLLSAQHTIIESAVSIADQYGVQTQIAASATGGINTVIRLHSRHDQLIDTFLCQQAQ